MPNEVIQVEALRGLSDDEVYLQQQQFGKNNLKINEVSRFPRIVWDIIREPMFIMLVVACFLYFVLGEANEGFMMLAAMLFVAAISVYQELKSSKALQALQQLTDPKVTVIRNGIQRPINLEELVPEDIMLLEEGVKIAADAEVIQENDLTVNESIITGESLPVEKSVVQGHNVLYQGTTVNSGKCYARVTATGNATSLGKLGKSISTFSNSKTLLQQQIESFLKRFTLFGIAAFAAIFFFNYINSGHIISSLLFSLTLAMSVLPEEIPVAFSSFMALGAYHLSKLGIITRQPQVVENLGAVTVICLDKTGTITENNMQVESIYDYDNDELINTKDVQHITNENVLRYALLASEENPFDPMEKAIWYAYDKLISKPYDSLKKVYEYELEGQPPMMTHVYEQDAIKIIAAKGAVERVIKVCRLDSREKEKILQLTRSLASKGCRVIGVANAIHSNGELPIQQDDFNWKFSGLLSLYDPPKQNIKPTLQQFYDAGITIKILTGDYPQTAMNIASQVGILNHTKYMIGEEVMALTEDQLQKAVREVNIFARMFPDAKLKVIDVLKANGAIVAMTGDGVNDGPALKSANIGIAMGQKGTEIARQSADLILTDDNLEKTVEAIRHGRKIFSNLKKAVRYILSIHIPIILTASLPVIFGWRFPNIFTPIHVIFLELIMGPTCSIFFEREPVEENSMRLPPRKRTAGLFKKEELLVSCVQGLAIAFTLLILYYNYMNNNYPLPYVRTVVFTTLVMGNIFLTFVTRSFTENMFQTMRYKNNLALPVFIISVFFLAAILLLPFMRNVFGLSVLSTKDFFICLASALAGVLWFELYKMYLKRSSETGVPAYANTAHDHSHALP